MSITVNFWKFETSYLLSILLSREETAAISAVSGNMFMERLSFINSNSASMGTFEAILTCLCGILLSPVTFLTSFFLFAYKSKFEISFCQVFCISLLILGQCSSGFEINSTANSFSVPLLAKVTFKRYCNRYLDNIDVVITKQLRYIFFTRHNFCYFESTWCHFVFSPT